MSEFIYSVSLNRCECPKTYLFQTLQWAYVCWALEKDFYLYRIPQTLKWNISQYSANEISLFITAEVLIWV